MTSVPVIQDFEAAGWMLAHITGNPGEVIDHPTRGTQGEFDSQDTFEYLNIDTGDIKRRKVGQKLFDDANFRMRVVEAAFDLAASGVEFSYCSATDSVNNKLWTRFGYRMQVRKNLQKNGMDSGELGSPAKGLRDIFKERSRGVAQKRTYGFECATAIMVILHKAILDTVGDEVFDKWFSDPSLLTFDRFYEKNKHYKDVEVISKKKVDLDDLVPGTCYYVENPDALDQAFLGENVVYLGFINDKHRFYAHGIVGASPYVVTYHELMRSLRALRKRGSKVEPFFSNFSRSINTNKLIKKLEQEG
ncbi:hypothetical protein ACFL6C_07575 [Myxococcota bacterium]